MQPSAAVPPPVARSRFAGLGLILWAIVAAFATYFSMYAFRKPFTAASFSGLQFAGIDYKIVLVISQVLGYMTSKFLGIKVISELRSGQRLLTLVFLLGVAEIALLGFALTPYPYNFPWLFLNGMPLGMIFGIVFSFLEGRKITELISIGLSLSIIVASGAMKTVGKLLLDDWHISQWWMPALAGLLFIPLLAVSTWMLAKLPPPTPEDVAARTARPPMTGPARRLLLRKYGLGILFLVILYILLTAFRDLRDNFAVEIWASLGYEGQPGMLTKSELAVAFFILLYIASVSFIRSNWTAFAVNHLAIVFGGLVLGISTLLFQSGQLSPVVWMVAAGFGLFLGYTVYQGMMFERMIAAFRETANVGFLMYLADSFGYLGSVTVLLLKNFAAPRIDWLSFFISAGYFLSVLAIALPLLSLWYFRRKMAAHNA